MAAEVGAQQVLFIPHALLLGPFQNSRLILHPGSFKSHVKQGALPQGLVLVHLGCAAEGQVHPLKQGAARFQRPVQRSRANQGFQNLLVDGFGIQPVADVLHAGEFPVSFPFLQKNLHGSFPHILDGRQSVAHGQLAGRRFLRSEFEHGFVHVGGQDFNAHAVGFLNEHADLVVVRFIGHQAAEEFHREVCLEVGRPVGNVAVTGGVGFVKAVPGEFLNLVKDGP